MIMMMMMESMSAENIQNDAGTRTGWFAIAMCVWWTVLCQCRNFWPLKTWPSSSNLLVWSANFWFILILCTKLQLWGHSFQAVSEILEQSLTDLHTIPKT
jgi:hypothetical protein